MFTELTTEKLIAVMCMSVVVFLIIVKLSYDIGTAENLALDVSYYYDPYVYMQNRNQFNSQIKQYSTELFDLSDHKGAIKMNNRISILDTIDMEDPSYSPKRNEIFDESPIESRRLRRRQVTIKDKPTVHSLPVDYSNYSDSPSPSNKMLWERLNKEIQHPAFKQLSQEEQNVILNYQKQTIEHPNWAINYNNAFQNAFLSLRRNLLDHLHKNKVFKTYKARISNFHQYLDQLFFDQIIDKNRFDKMTSNFIKKKEQIESDVKAQLVHKIPVRDFLNDIRKLRETSQSKSISLIDCKLIWSLLSNEHLFLPKIEDCDKLLSLYTTNIIKNYPNKNFVNVNLSPIDTFKLLQRLKHQIVTKLPEQEQELMKQYWTTKMLSPKQSIPLVQNLRKAQINLMNNAIEYIEKNICNVYFNVKSKFFLALNNVDESKLSKSIRQIKSEMILKESELEPQFPILTELKQIQNIQDFFKKYYSLQSHNNVFSDYDNWFISDTIENEQLYKNALTKFAERMYLEYEKIFQSNNVPIPVRQIIPINKQVDHVVLKQLSPQDSKLIQAYWETVSTNPHKIVNMTAKVQDAFWNLCVKLHNYINEKLKDFRHEYGKFFDIITKRAKQHEITEDESTQLKQELIDQLTDLKKNVIINSNTSGNVKSYEDFYDMYNLLSQKTETPDKNLQLFVFDFIQNEQSYQDLIDSFCNSFISLRNNILQTSNLPPPPPPSALYVQQPQQSQPQPPSALHVQPQQSQPQPPSALHVQPQSNFANIKSEIEKIWKSKYNQDPFSDISEEFEPIDFDIKQHRPVPFEPFGIANPPKTLCFLNSAIQTLLSCPKVFDKIQNTPEANQSYFHKQFLPILNFILNKENANQLKLFSQPESDFIEKIWKNLILSDPDKVFGQLGNERKSIIQTIWRDAGCKSLTDLTQKYINLSQETNVENQNKIKKAFDDIVQYMTMQQECSFFFYHILNELKIKDLFSFQRCEVVQCTKCNNSKVLKPNDDNYYIKVECPYELFLILSEGKISTVFVADRTNKEYSAQPDFIEYKCNSNECNNTNQTFLRTTFYNFTNPYFIVQFTHNGYNNEKPKSFPISAKLQNAVPNHLTTPIPPNNTPKEVVCSYHTPNSSSQSCHLISQIQFNGGICHNDNLGNCNADVSGHYFTYSRRITLDENNVLNQKVYKFNDSSVGESEFQDVLDDHTNVLVYATQKD